MTLSSQSAALRRVDRGNLCSGCGACAALAPEAIEMRLDASGYLRPHQNSPVSAAKDRDIARVCPGLGQTVVASDRRDDPLWGPVVSVQSGWARNEALRYEASSGGALSAVLSYLVDSGTVAGVLHVRADPDRPEANLVTLSRTVDDIRLGVGSRYAPSAPLAALPDLDAQLPGAPLAFVGKPCDAAAMRALCDTNPALNARFPVILSFFCAGVPSLEAAGQIMADLGVGPAEVTGFRYRGHGWPGFATATLKDGSEHKMSYRDSWGSRLSPRVQHRCKICADGSGAAADIAFADAWDTDAAGYPVFEERDGVSLVLTRTEAGEALLKQAVAAGMLHTAPYDLTGLAAVQPGQTQRRQALLARLLALALLGRPIPRYRGLHLRAAARTAPLSHRLRNFAGMARRVLRGQTRSR